MLEDCSENEAYRHLLSVAENILNSLSPDSSIIDKYYRLKSAILSKAFPDSPAHSPSHTKKLLSAYKYVTGSLIEAVTQFEAQIESQMEREVFSNRVVGMVKEWEIRLQDLKNEAEGLPSKAKLVAKE